MSNFKLSFVLLLALGAQLAHAETIVSQRIKATHRLLPPKKITVGPDDQYQGMADPSGQSLVFTHKSDLVPHLCRQNLATGEVSDLLPLTADSQEPAFSPEGVVAFTYYKFNARGDICYAVLPRQASAAVAEDRITCLKPAASETQFERSNPFWRSASELGFVLRDMSTQISQIVTENIKTGERKILAQGKVWSPAMKPGGRYLFYTELARGDDSSSRVLMLEDLMTSVSRPVHFALPGISGFPAVSDDEKYLYFSHYSDDTNNDNIIDGSDNSVVFRAPIDSLLKTPPSGEFFPEQLTSVENNCSFPRPFEDSVYVSCAFEGSLDVYQIPATGIVPSDWDQRLLDNAHQTSRTYAERILLLNTIKYRFHPSDENLRERLLGDHLLADDMTASQYYIDRLQATSRPGRKDFYSLLRLYLTARQKKKSQPSAEITREFQKQILAIDDQVQAVRGQPRFRTIVRGLLRAFLEQPREADGFLQQVRFDTPALPLERYFDFELASSVYPRTKADGPRVEALVEAYKRMAGAVELTEESQIYYAFNLLSYLQGALEDGDAKALERRIVVIGKLNHGLPEPVTELLDSEIATLKIIRAQGDADKTKAYADLDKLMSKSRDDYFLRKALYVRAILNFSDAAEFKFLDFVATNWIRYTANGDTEFIHAREIYAQTELQHAYASWGQRSYQLAGNYFYGSLSLTDDLESHSGYIRMMVERGARKTIDERYKNLTERQFVGDNIKFVEALLGLIDAAPEAAKDPSSVKHLDQAIAKLEAMEQDRDSPVRYLLLGYCYLAKLLRTSSGYEVDPSFFQSAHRDLMLAYDLGRDNARIKAAALMDLGILHQRAQNHGLAAKFFALREPLGFSSSVEAGSFAWLYARSLYYTHEADKAAEELAHSPGDVPQEFVGPLLEHEAFYRTAARQYGQASELYAKLLESGYIQGDANLAKVNLSYGFALFSLKREKEAQAVLRTSLLHADRLAPVSKGKDRLIDFDPLRIKLVAYGLLSRTGSDSERLTALEKRAELLPQAQKLFDTSYLPTVIENRLYMGALYTKVQPAAAASRMKEALKLAEELGDSDAGYLSNAVYRVATEYLAHAWLHSEFYAGEDPGRIRKVVEKCLHAYEHQQGPQPLLDYQRLKLELLWAAFSSKVLKSGPPVAQEIHQLAASERAKGIKDPLPAQWKELQALSVALAR